MIIEAYYVMTTYMYTNFIIKFKQKVSLKTTKNIKTEKLPNSV